MIIFINILSHFLLLSCFSLNSAVLYASQVSYSDQCSLIIPYSTPITNTTPSFPLGHFHTGYGGGSDIFKQTPSSFSKSFVFRTRNAYYTQTQGVLKVEADLLFPSPDMHNYNRNFSSGRVQPAIFSSVSPGLMGRDLVRFSLNGFWSESSGKLCMVGSSRMKIGGFLDLEAVLKLENINNLTSVVSLISGTLACLNSSDQGYCFEPISVLMLPQMNYEYSLVSEEFDNRSDAVKNIPFSSMPGPDFCSEGWWPPNGFNLKYASSCISVKNCGPFGRSGSADLPHVVFISGFGCLNKERRVRVIVEFSKTRSDGFYQPFYPNTTLVGEGYWNEKKLSVVACQFLDVAESLASARVGDCSIKLSLSFSATLSIRDASNVLGEIWTNKTVHDPGYFDSIMFQSSEDRIVGVPGLKYEYTETERVRKSCPNSVENNKGTYPNWNSIHMRFDMSIRSSEGKIALGYAIPFSVSDQFYGNPFHDASLSRLRPANSAAHAKFSSSPVNISYKIGLTILSDLKVGKATSLFTGSSNFNEVEISAEGTYNKKSGSLCMIGCRSLDLDNQTDDCEILLKFQFSLLGEERKEGYIKGNIQSTRKKSDPLYFEALEASSVAHSIIQAKQFIWRMDMEIAIAIISSILSTVFVALQHLHIKRQPHVLPLISLVMLSILILGHLLPLLVKVGSLLLQNDDQQYHFLGIWGYLEANEVILNLLEMAAFFFQFRLLQLTWIARFNDRRRKGVWLAEKTALLVSVLIYAAAGLIALLMNWGNKGLDLKIYTGVILDGFLFPQIMLNVFRDSNEHVLVVSFYIGNTFLRLLPHVHNLYESYIYLLQFSSWEVILVLGGLIFAAAISLQQQHGGSFLLSQRSRVVSV